MLDMSRSNLARESPSNPFVGTLEVVEATAPSIVVSSFLVTPVILIRSVFSHLCLNRGSYGKAGIYVAFIIGQASVINPCHEAVGEQLLTFDPCRCVVVADLVNCI